MNESNGGALVAALGARFAEQDAARMAELDAEIRAGRDREPKRCRDCGLAKRDCDCAPSPTLAAQHLAPRLTPAPGHAGLVHEPSGPGASASKPGSASVARSPRPPVSTLPPRGAQEGGTPAEPETPATPAEERTMPAHPPCPKCKSAGRHRKDCERLAEIRRGKGAQAPAVVARQAARRTLEDVAAVRVRGGPVRLEVKPTADFHPAPDLKAYTLDALIDLDHALAAELRTRREEASVALDRLDQAIAKRAA